MAIKNILLLIIAAMLFSTITKAQVHPVFREVDHILWVVNDLKKTQKGWREIGFTEMDELKKVNLISHGLKDEKGKIKATIAYLGGAKALWIQPVKETSILSRYLERNGEGAVALIHKVKDETELNDLTQQLARVNIGKIATYTMETKTGNLKYTIMDTREKGKYYLGFVIDERTRPADFTGKNELNMKFNQYAFAIKDNQPVSNFWASAGLPAMEITHGELWEKEYFGKAANFDMNLGWQRHGTVVYEWCIPLAGPTVYADHIRVHGEGIQHFGFAVENMDDAIDFFENKGYKVSMSGGWGDKGKPGSGRFTYIDLSKIGGMTIELLWNYKE